MFSKSVFAVFTALLLFAVVSVGCGQSTSRTYMFGASSKKGWLGVGVQDVTQRFKEKKHLEVDAGAYVTNVVEESPADVAGIQEGDVIVRFDGKTIENSDDLIKVVRRTKPKTEVKIDIVRGKDRKTLAATVRRNASPEAFSFRFNDKDLIPPIPPEPFKMQILIKHILNGLEVQTLTKQLGEYFEAPNGRGVLVSEVKKASSADKAGFKAGDIIIKVNNTAVSDVDELREELSDAADKDVQCEVIRKGKALTLTMHADEEEEDDDLSGGLMIHPGRGHWQLHEGDLSSVRHGELRNLKEHLKELGARMRENLHRLKERLKEDLHHL